MWESASGETPPDTPTRPPTTTRRNFPPGAELVRGFTLSLAWH